MIKKKENVVVISGSQQNVIDKMKDFQQTFECYQTQLNQCAQKIQKIQQNLENQINQKLHHLFFFFFFSFCCFLPFGFEKTMMFSSHCKFAIKT